MPSAIDPTVPIDGIPASKADLRANLATAKAELEHGGFAEGLSPANYSPPRTSRTVDHLQAIDEALGAPGGASSFLGLTDAPSSYLGQANHYPRVRGDEAGLEFVEVAASGDASTTSYTGPGTGAIPRTVRDKLGEVISVKDFGAVGDGATDDRAAIQAAIDYASSIGGGIVEMPAGVFVTSASILLPSGVILRGRGHTSTVIRLAAGANAHVIKTDNFDAQTGQDKWFVDADSVRHGFGLLHLTIDGNRTNNVSGHGVAFYGKNYIVDGVFIVNAASDGFYSECGTAVGQTDDLGHDSPETQIGFLRVRKATGAGFRWRGPHDGTIGQLIVSGYGFDGKSDGVSIETGGTFSGTCDIRFLHVYSARGAESRGLFINEKCRIAFAVVETSGRENVFINNHNTQIGILFAYLAKNLYTGADLISNVRINGTENNISNLRIHINGNADAGLFISGSENRIASCCINGLSNTRPLYGLRVWGNRNSVAGNIEACDNPGSIAIAIGTNFIGNSANTVGNDINVNILNCAAALSLRGTRTRTRIRAAVEAITAGQVLFASESDTARGASEAWDVVSWADVAGLLTERWNIGHP